MSTTSVIDPLLSQYELNSRLLLNCVEALSESQMRERPSPEVNSPAFLVAHLIDTRHYLLSMLGKGATNPVAPYVADATSMADVKELPPADALRAHWEEAAPLLRDALRGAGNDLLAAKTQRLPGTDGTVLGAIAFLLQHESYHIGQLSLIRRMLGFPAMEY